MKPTPEAIAAAKREGVNASDSFCPECGAIYEWSGEKCDRCGSSEKPVPGSMAMSAKQVATAPMFGKPKK